MALSSGANTAISYVAEVTHGVTPNTPTMKTLRVTSRNINLQKQTLGSQERRADRQIADVRHGFQQVGGSLGFELSMESFDDWLEAALGGTWATGATTGSMSLASSSTGNKVIRASGSFIANGFMPGDVVTLAGFATSGNNGVTTVLSVTALELTVAKTLVTDTDAAARTVTASGKKLKVGGNLRTFTIERGFTDVTQYQVFAGCAINQMSLQIQPNQIIGGSFDMIGMSNEGFTGTSLGTPTAAPATSPFDAFTGALYVNGVANAVVTGVNFQVANGRSVQPVVGSKFSPDVFEGTATVTGQLTAFFEDATIYNMFLNESEVALFFRMNDGANFQVWCAPRIKLTSGDMDPPQEGPIVTTYNFQALVDANSGTCLAVQRSNA